MESNFIIHQSAKTYEWSGDCFLSVKSFYNGVAAYHIGQRQYRVNQNNFLVLNECTKYHLIIDTPVETESFCVFFNPDFVSNSIAEYTATDEQLLDHKLKKHQGLCLFERNYPHQGTLSKVLLKGKIASSSGMTALQTDEFYHNVLTSLLQQNFLNSSKAQTLSQKKKATRQEIYQRIYYAKDYMDCNFQKDLRLNEIAGVAYMSTNHFLRNFKQLFGQSPFQYLSMLKIRQAHHQILNTNTSIQIIARDVGYSSMSNFSSYFKAVIGRSPSDLRKSDI